MAPKRQRTKTMEARLQELAESERLLPSSQSVMNSDSGETSRVVRGRGTARTSHEWGTGRRLHIDFNPQWQPIGPNKEIFTSQLGIIAKNGNMISLTYFSWRDVPTEILDRIWKEVKDNTDVNEEYRPHCMKTIRNIWRDWKARVKREYYKPYSTDDERLAFTPPRVNQDQWRTLVAYWGTEEAQAIARKNKENRAHQFAPHRTGRTSFTKTRDEMMKKWEKTDRNSVFIKTRTRSSGEVGDTESTEIISQFNQSLSQIPIEEQTTEVREKIWSQVMGPDHRGYARTHGYGPSPTNVRPSSSQQSGGGHMQEELNNLRVENQQLQAKVDMMYSFLQRQFPSIEEHMVPPDRQQVSDAGSAHQDRVGVNTEPSNDEDT